MRDRERVRDARDGRHAALRHVLRGRKGAIVTAAAALALGTGTGLAVATGVGPPDPGCYRIDGPGNDDAGVAMGDLAVNGVTLQFFQTGQGTAHFTLVDPPGATFTGAITMKGGPDPNGVSFSFTDVTEGDVHTPVNPNNGKYYGISHADSCGGAGTTTTSTTTTTETTTTDTTTTDTTTTDTTTTDTTTTDTTTDTTTTTGTTTDTTTGTQGVAGTTAGGGGDGKGGKSSKPSPAGASDPGGSVATAAQPAGGSLAFTGLAAPLLALLGAGLAGAGLVLRRRLTGHG